MDADNIIPYPASDATDNTLVLLDIQIDRMLRQIEYGDFEIIEDD